MVGRRRQHSLLTRGDRKHLFGGRCVLERRWGGQWFRSGGMNLLLGRRDNSRFEAIRWDEWGMEKRGVKTMKETLQRRGRVNQQVIIAWFLHSHLRFC
jgi:hypothetical protein